MTRFCIAVFCFMYQHSPPEIQYF